MIRVIPTPPVPELARAKGESVMQIVDWFVEYYNRGSVFFNYRSSTRAIRSAYQGLHDLNVLRSAVFAEKTRVGRVSNDEVITLAAPYSFGRATQVFDISPRRFSFGHERNAAYRIPFLFVEGGIIKVYFLQPRKGAGLTLDEFGMIGSIIKRYLLDQEFYGEKCDIEVIDVGAPMGCSAREARRYSLCELPLWSESRLADRLTLISEALDIIQKDGLVVPRSTHRKPADPSMPLFD